MKKLDLQPFKGRMLLLIALALSLGACDKPDSTYSPENEKTDGISVNDLGILRFESTKSFHAKLAEFDKGGVEFTKELLGKLNYTSYLADTLDDSKNIGDFDPVLSLILNDKSAIQIGDSITFFTKDFEYSIASTEKELYKSIAENPNKLLTSKISKREVFYPKFQVQFEDAKLQKKSSNTQTINFSGSYTLFTPEENIGGRPERIKFVFETRSVSGAIRSTLTAYGEAYRRGGLFGSRSWRADEIDYLIYDIIRAKASIQSSADGPIYGINRSGQTSPILYSTPTGIGASGPVSSWVDVLDIRFSRIDMGGISFTASFLWERQTSGSTLLRITKSW